MSDECQHETICSDCGAMTTGYAALTARAEAAEQQAARLRAALEFYADNQSWMLKRRYWDGTDSSYVLLTDVQTDAGARARVSLARTPEAGGR